MGEFIVGKRVILSNAFVENLGGRGQFLTVTGVLMAIKCRYPGTPLEHVLLSVRFPNGLFVSPAVEQVYELDLLEGNVEKPSKGLVSDG